MVIEPNRAWYPCALALVTGVLAACSSSSEPPADSGDISFASCNSAWVAVQDGDGAWTQVLPAGSNYAFTIESGRGGFARVQLDQRPSIRHLDIVYGTVAELRNAAAAAGFSACGDPVPMVGTIVDGGEDSATTTVHLGMWRAFVSGFDVSFSVSGAPGVRDLYALRNQSSLRTLTVLQRLGVNVTSGGTLAPFDYSGPETFVPVTSSVTISGMSGDTVLVKSSFFGHDNSVFFELNHFSGTNGANEFTYQSIPAVKLQAGDLQLIEAVDQKLNAGYRQAGVYYTSAADRTLTLGPDLNVPTGSIVGSTPNTRLRVQVASQSEYNRIMTAGFEQLQTASTDGPGYVRVAVTANYLGGVPATWDITIPDFSGVAGWNPVWGLSNEGSIYWYATGQAGAVPALDATITNGATTRRALRLPAS